MSYYVYILQSLKDNKFYIGSSQNVKARLQLHNNGLQRSTRHRTPFVLLYEEELPDKSAAIKREKQILIGFALETVNEKDYAREKLNKKNADMIVLNSLNDAGAGFGHDTNKITIFQRNGSEVSFDTKTKNEVAKDIVDTIINSYYA